MITTLEVDLFNSDYIVKKCKDINYAQNLYAALCNNRFFKNGFVWTASWRVCGGIVADLRNCKETYLDWYCSGMIDKENFMREGCISSEIHKDISDIGWAIEPYDCSENDL